MKIPNNIIVLDLEATCCWSNDNLPENAIHETIEIGAVRIINGKMDNVFQQYVKPKVNPILDIECTNLTGITQSTIDNAPSFPEALSAFMNWMNLNSDTIESELPWLISWGHYDRFQLAQDCTRFNLDTNWLFRHTSLKHEYMRLNKSRRPVGLGKALRNENLVFDGRPHSGLDDAINISKIFNIYSDRLEYVKQTSITK